MLLYLMAIVFTGQALVEFQVIGRVPSHYLPGFPSVAWLGLAPTLQGVAIQSIMALLPPVAWLWMRRPAQEKK